MKKYDCSVMDFSEIENITSDYVKIKEASDKMKTLGMMNDDGSINETRIKQIVNDATIGNLQRLYVYIESANTMHKNNLQKLRMISAEIF